LTSDIRHVCSFHHNSAQQMLEAAPWVAESLSRSERCIIVSDEPDTWVERYPLAGDARDNGGHGISIWPGNSWRPHGRFKSLTMAKHVWWTIEQELEESPGLTIVVDMRWVLAAEIPAPALCHWEATLDALLPADSPVHVLCQYDLSLPVAMLHAGLRTHRWVGASGSMLENPCFEAGAILAREPDLNECSSDSVLVGNLLAQFLPPDSRLGARV
jgi:hypothetical protein